MRQIMITLPDALYGELEAVAASTEEFCYSPERWAQEVVENELASRRLPRVRMPMTKAEALQRQPVAAESIYDL
ncbi:MAG TPA: hypothetical protein VFQ00_03285 [Terriglobales bacterium]|nr:hypothetical protein [Terriglobales bacterium]